jgi:hypothetical protein
VVHAHRRLVDVGLERVIAVGKGRDLVGHRYLRKKLSLDARR